MNAARNSGLSDIRLRYSVIINYTSSLFRILASTGFIVLVARKVTITEFGLWGLIFSLTTILARFTRLWSFWAQRHIVYELQSSGRYGFYRNVMSTSLILTLAYNLLSTMMYLSIGYVYSLMFGFGFNYFLASVPMMLFLEYFILFSDMAITLKPEQVGFSYFILDVTRISLAFTLVYWLRMGLYGAIYSIEAAYLVALVYIVVQLVRKAGLRVKVEKIHLDLVKMWFHSISIPFFLVSVQILELTDRSVLPAVTGNVDSVAYLNVAYSTRGPLASSASVFMGGLYAKLLRDPRGEYVEEVLRLFLLLNVALAVLIIGLAKPIVSLLNPLYVSVAYLLIPTAIGYAMYNLENMFLGAIMGGEQFDRMIRSHREIELKKTKTFRMHLYRFIRSVAVIVVATIIALILTNNPILQATSFVFAKAIGFIVAALVAFYYARKILSFRIPWRELGVFLLAGIIVYVLYVFLGVEEMLYGKFTEQLKVLVEYALLGITVYYALSYALSPWLRSLTRRILEVALSFLKK